LLFILVPYVLEVIIMIKINNFDFQIPHQWLTLDNGSTCYPSNISDWFPNRFDFYFRYEHPIIIEPEFLPEQFKNILEKKIWTDFYQFTLPEFLSIFFPSLSSNRTFDEFRIKKPFNTLPDYIFGQIKGNLMKMSEISVILECIVYQNENVVINNDMLRNGIILDSDYIDTFFKTSTDYLLSMKDLIAPNYILEENRRWCLTTPYDCYFSIIACDKEYADKLRKKEDIGILEITNTET
jgi:hypothetical protein